MRGVQDPANSGAVNDKALLDQLTQASRGNLPPHAHNIDPAIAGAPPPPVPMMGNNAVEASQDAERKGGKRELSTSKRAAQNRAAQRAFRQRKEGHIKKLEEQVRDYGVLLEHYKRLQSENLTLRDYIIALQGRLIEAQGEFPQPPLNIDLNAPRDDQLPPAIQNALAVHNAGSAAANDTPMQGTSDPAPHEAPPPPPQHTAPTATMQGVSSQLQQSAAQAVAKSTRRGQHTHSAANEKSIEERTDPALK